MSNRSDYDTNQIFEEILSVKVFQIMFEFYKPCNITTPVVNTEGQSKLVILTLESCNYA